MEFLTLVGHVTNLVNFLAVDVYKTGNAATAKRPIIGGSAGENPFIDDQADADSSDSSSESSTSSSDDTDDPIGGFLNDDSFFGEEVYENPYLYGPPAAVDDDGADIYNMFSKKTFKFDGVICMKNNDKYCLMRSVVVALAKKLLTVPTNVFGDEKKFHRASREFHKTFYRFVESQHRPLAVAEKRQLIAQVKSRHKTVLQEFGPKARNWDKQINAAQRKLKDTATPLMVPKFSSIKDQVMPQVAKIAQEMNIAMDNQAYDLQTYGPLLQTWIDRNYGVDTLQLFCFDTAQVKGQKMKEERDKIYTPIWPNPLPKNQYRGALYLLYDSKKNHFHPVTSVRKLFGKEGVYCDFCHKFYTHKRFHLKSCLTRCPKCFSGRQVDCDSPGKQLLEKKVEEKF